MEISIANKQRRIGIRSSRAKKIVSSVLERELSVPGRGPSVVGREPSRLEPESACFDEISIVFLSDKAMRELNRLFTGRDLTTDTLAFELTPDMGKGRPVSGIKLGEVIVCVDRAIAQSKRYRVSIEKELARLLIHGLLHLCGFEDGTKTGRVKMHKRENLHLDALGDAVSKLVAAPLATASAARRANKARRANTASRANRAVPKRK